MTHLRRACDAVSPSAATACYAARLKASARRPKRVPQPTADVGIIAFTSHATVPTERINIEVTGTTRGRVKIWSSPRIYRHRYQVSPPPATRTRNENRQSFVVGGKARIFQLEQIHGRYYRADIILRAENLRAILREREPRKQHGSK